VEFSLQAVSPEPEWNPESYADRDWLLVAADRLSGVTRSVASAVSFNEMLRAVAETCVGIGGAESAGVYLLEPDRTSFRVGWEATVPDWPHVRAAGDLIPLAEWHGMVRALEMGEPISWKRSDPLLSDFEHRHYLAEGVGSGIDVPLVCRNETLGFLKLFRREETEWNTRDVTIASIVGSSIALALTSEQLLDRAVQQSLDQGALAALAQVAITSREPRDLLQRVAEQIQALLPFPCVDIELWTTELDRAEIVAHAAIDGWPGPTNGVVFYQLSNWPTDLRMLRELRTFTNDVDDELPDIERAYFKLRNLKQLHYVPLMYGERCLGAIILHANERVELDQRLSNLINEIAAITTLAAHAARSLRETAWERRAQHWQLRVNRMLLDDAPLGTVLEEILASFIDMTLASIVIVELVDPATNQTIERRMGRSGVSPRLDALIAESRTWPIVQAAIATRHKQIERISDDNVGPAVAWSLLEAGPEWIAVAPVYQNGQNLGALTLLFKSGFNPGEDQRDFIRQMTRQLALVATSHQSRLDHEFASRRSAIMVRVSQAAVSISDPYVLLQEIARVALDVDQVDACEIERYNRGAQLVYNDRIAFAGDWSYVYDTERTHRIEDIPTFASAIERMEPTSYLMSDAHVAPFERDAFREIGIESVLVIPLAYGHETLGVLSLLRREPRPFSARAMTLANELATHASLALGRAQLFEALQARANSDGVTGLSNHRAILERIDAELAAALAANSPLSLMLIDLDSFKSLNDARGHLVGDRFLREVANLIQQTIGDLGEAARYGGDEYLVLLPNCDERECARLALQLLESCRNASFILDNVEVSCQFSVGLATAPRHGVTRDELIGHADRAMYDAKQHGGGRIGVTPS
jgi:diguanylate cyclase (GGDEF)-like protein